MTPAAPVQRPGSPCSPGLSLSPTHGAPSCAVSGSGSSISFPPPAPHPGVLPLRAPCPGSPGVPLENTAPENPAGEPRWRTPLENSDSSPAASSPAASHCLMSTKYFHVANYLVRLCCCGQRWRRGNPPGAGLAPREQGEPRLGLPRAEHPHPHHAPRHPPAPSPWGHHHQQPPNDVPASPVTFPWPQRDADGYSGKASPSQDLNWPLRDLEKALEPPFPRRRWFGV